MYHSRTKHIVNKAQSQSLKKSLSYMPSSLDWTQIESLNEIFFLHDLIVRRGEIDGQFMLVGKIEFSRAHTYLTSLPSPSVPMSTSIKPRHFWASPPSSLAMCYEFLVVIFVLLVCFKFLRGNCYFPPCNVN